MQHDSGGAKGRWWVRERSCNTKESACKGVCWLKVSLMPQETHTDQCAINNKSYPVCLRCTEHGCHNHLYQALGGGLTSNCSQWSARMREFHVTLRLYHVVALAILIIGACHLHGAPVLHQHDGHGSSSQERSSMRGISPQELRSLVSGRTEGAPPPEHSQYGSARDRSSPSHSSSMLTAVSTPHLISELQRRNYTWEALAAAQLQFSDFTAVELVHWLQRDASRFRNLLEQSGLQCHSALNSMLLCPPAPAMLPP